MNVHKNARLTPHGREQIVRQVAVGEPEDRGRLPADRLQMGIPISRSGVWADCAIAVRVQWALTADTKQCALHGRADGRDYARRGSLNRGHRNHRQTSFSMCRYLECWQPQCQRRLRLTLFSLLLMSMAE